MKYSLFSFIFITSVISFNCAMAATPLRSAAFPPIEASVMPQNAFGLFADPSLDVVQAMMRKRIKIGDLEGSSATYTGFAINLADADGNSFYVDNLIPIFEKNIAYFRWHARMYFHDYEIAQHSLRPQLEILGNSNIILSDDSGSIKEFQITELPTFSGRGTSLLRQTVSVTVANLASLIRPDISANENFTLNRNPAENDALQLMYHLPKSSNRPETGELKVFVPLKLEDQRGNNIAPDKIIDFGFKESGDVFGDIFVVALNETGGLTRFEFFDVVEVAKDEIIAAHRLLGRRGAIVHLADYDFRATVEEILQPMQQAFMYRASRITQLPAPIAVCQARVI